MVAVLMFGFGYALVPLYRAICDALGINVLSLSQQKTADFGRKSAGANSQVDRTRTITVEFDANARGPWEFKPAQRSLAVHPGELQTVEYEFTNVQSRTMTAQAIPSYAPMQASPYFNKLQCFCFNEWTLAPGETTVPIDPTSFPAERPATAIAGLLYDRLVEQGVDGSTANCAITTAYQTASEDQLIAMGLAAANPDAIAIVTKGALDCGIPQDVVDAAIAAQFGS